MEASQAGWRPLGQLIVQRGLITQQRLEEALVEQQTTHKRLGTILVETGTVTAQQLTNALADQTGIEALLDELDTADGVGAEDRARSLGDPIRRLRVRLFGSTASAHAGAQEEPEEPEPEMQPPAAEHPPHDWLVAAREALERVEGERARDEEEISRLHALVDERDDRLAAIEARVEELEAQVGELAESLSAKDEKLGIEIRAREQAQRDLEQRDARIARLAPHVEALAQELDVVVEATPEPQPAHAPVAEAEEGEAFLFFVPRAGDGYGLVEQSGEAPAVGSTVDLEGENFEVTRLSRSPLPFDRRVCAHLRSAR